MYKIILHATELKENHYDICMKSVQLAKHFHAKLHLIHVIEIPSSLQWAQSLGFAPLAPPEKDGAQIVMSTLSEALKIPKTHLHIEIGPAYSHILALQKKLAADLITLGGEAAHNLPTLPGSTAHAILHHAPCDVLILRA